MTVGHWLTVAQGTTASGSEGTTQSRVPLTSSTLACIAGPLDASKSNRRGGLTTQRSEPWDRPEILVSSIQPAALQQPAEVAIGIVGILATDSELSAGGLQSTQLKGGCGTPRVANNRNGSVSTLNSDKS